MYIFSFRIFQEIHFRIFQEIYLETGISGGFWKEGCGMKDNDGKTFFCIWVYC